MGEAKTKSSRMPSYTLKYFNARGRAEVTRMLFAQAGVAYEDIRYELPFGNPEEWQKVKPTIRFEKLPVLEIDGEPMTQSLAIAYYLAREFGLAGSNALEEGRSYEAFFSAQDLMEAAWKTKMEKDEARQEEMKKNYMEKEMPRLLTALETLLGDRDYFVSSGVTIGDFNVFLVTDGLVRLSKEHEKLVGVLEKFPKLSAHRARVAALPNIAAWLAKRPETPM